MIQKLKFQLALNFTILQILIPGFCPQPFQAFSVIADSFLTWKKKGQQGMNHEQQ